MKKLLLGLGTIASVATPVALVLSCGSSLPPQNKEEGRQMTAVLDEFDRLDGQKSSVKNSPESYPLMMHTLSPETIGFSEPNMPKGFKVKYTFLPDEILGGFKASAFVTYKGASRISQFEILGFKTNSDVFDNYVNFCNKVKGLSGRTTLAKAPELNNVYLVDKAAGGLIPSKPEDMGFVSPKLPPEVDSISYSLEPSYKPGIISVSAIIFPSSQTMMAGGNLVEEHFTLTGFGTKPGITYLY